MSHAFQPDASPHEVLRTHFGYDEFRGCQHAVIDRVTGGGHAMVVMPTGMGKSLCYQIPAMMMSPPMADRRPPIVLVLSPLVALMRDQVTVLREKNIDAAFINSSLDRSSREQCQRDVMNGRVSLLYVTPERFRKPEFREALLHREVALLAVDEAHCVSQWGHDFRPDYSRLADIRQSLGNPTTIALTATATAECRADIVRQLGLDSDAVTCFHEGIDRPNLELRVTHVRDEDEKFAAIQDHLSDQSLFGGQTPGGAILYFSLIQTLCRFSDRLTAAGIDHVVYHGDLDRQRRRRAQDEFMTGRADTVLATPAFGMGIDKEDIRLVMHAETPGSIESYYQEIGRAGRDGKPSRCVWLYDQADLMTQMQFIEWANPDASFYGRVMHELTHHRERWTAFGLEDLRNHLQRVSRHDHRLDTAIAMLDRYGVVAGPRPPACFDVIAELPDRFLDDERLGEKRRRDQKRLYAMVLFAGLADEARQAFLNGYFLGVDAPVRINDDDAF